MLFFGCRERLAQGRGVAVFQSFTKPDLIPETFVRRSGRCGKRIGRNGRSACAARRGAIFSAEISRISRKMLFLRLTRARYDRKADSESLDCGVRGRPLGMRGRLLLYRRGRRDARHNAAYHGRRAGRLPAGTLRRRDGTRPRSQGVYVDLRSELAAEPAQPQRDGQRRPPYRLQPASGRQYRRPERRPLRRDGQTAGRSVGVCRQAGRTASRRRFDPRIRRPRKGPW